MILSSPLRYKRVYRKRGGGKRGKSWRDGVGLSVSWLGRDVQPTSLARALFLDHAITIHRTRKEASVKTGFRGMKRKRIRPLSRVVYEVSGRDAFKMTITRNSSFNIPCEGILKIVYNV